MRRGAWGLVLTTLLHTVWAVPWVNNDAVTLNTTQSGACRPSRCCLHPVTLCVADYRRPWPCSRQLPPVPTSSHRSPTFLSKRNHQKALPHSRSQHIQYSPTYSHQAPSLMLSEPCLTRLRYLAPSPVPLWLKEPPQPSLSTGLLSQQR